MGFSRNYIILIGGTSGESRWIKYVKVVKKEFGKNMQYFVVGDNDGTDGRWLEKLNALSNI